LTSSGTHFDQSLFVSLDAETNCPVNTAELLNNRRCRFQHLRFAPNLHILLAVAEKAALSLLVCVAIRNKLPLSFSARGIVE